ncbi:virulence RhuM family protein [Candidatus Peregrinibacteria bacterium]|nr:MAG: virulence RhuM family protein [Candidatus Peregrinibacteria bacterium]
MNDSQIILYDGDDGLRIQVLLENESVWLTLNQIADLFDRDKSTISKHIKNIFDSVELSPDSVVAIFATTASDGKTYQVEHYNLDLIISVGYRVNSLRGTQFRIWATQRLKEYLIKGFILDDERLKEGKRNTYFDELIERVREIRTSERNFYRKITDIYATSIDYDAESNLTQNFFATVQNKMHFGIHGKTAAEVIAERADCTKPNMGLTSTSGKKLQKKDVFVAKNYLTEDELEELNLIVDQYLSFAELQAKNNKAMRMEDWIRKLDDFLRLNEKEILQNKGVLSKKLADQKAEAEFTKFKALEDKNYVSDFDKSVKKFLKENR